MKKNIIIFIYMLLIASCASISKNPTGEKLISLRGYTEVQGHRGARGVRPENTLSAFEYAFNLGVDNIELDILMTKDEKLVVHHDPYVNFDLCKWTNNKKNSGKIPIISLTLSEIKELDCGSLKNSKFKEQELKPGEKVPLLSEVFELVNKFGNKIKTKINIEIKSEEKEPSLYPTPEKFVDLLLKEIKKYKMEKRVVILSFDFRPITIVKKLKPDIRTTALVEEKMDYSKVLNDTKADILSPYYELLNVEMVKELHKNYKLVIPWTVNEEKDFKDCFDLGVDGIVTDYPEKLKQYMKTNKLF